MGPRTAMWMCEFCGRSVRACAEAPCERWAPAAFVRGDFERAQKILPPPPELLSVADEQFRLQVAYELEQVASTKATRLEAELARAREALDAKIDIREASTRDLLAALGRRLMKKVRKR